MDHVFIEWYVISQPCSRTASQFLFTATISQLRARKQRYKLSMFERLYYILIFTVIVIAIFFVVSSFSFSGRKAEGTFTTFCLLTRLTLLCRLCR